MQSTVADFVGALVSELARMARAARLTALAFILDMAAQEAAEICRRSKT